MIDWPAFDKALREPPPVVPDTRVRCEEMVDDPYPVPAGTEGTVLPFSNGAQLWVQWDNGASAALLVGIDKWAVVEVPAHQD